MIQKKIKTNYFEKITKQLKTNSSRIYKKIKTMIQKNIFEKVFFFYSYWSYEKTPLIQCKLLKVKRNIIKKN